MHAVEAGTSKMRALPAPPCPRGRIVARCSRHFRRESLYASGLAHPEDVVQHCLTLVRKCDAAALADFLPPAAAAADPAAPPALSVGGALVREQGPLAHLNQFFDVGARRLLPGHLLRRSRVLGTLRLSPGVFQQRIALTARSGEESVFLWQLQRQEAPPLTSVDDIDSGDTNGSSGGGGGSSGGDGRRWVVCRVERDAQGDAPLPTTPQPKAAPEAVVGAQLAALARADVFEASAFNSWRGSDPMLRRRGGKKPFTLALNYDLMMEAVAEGPGAALLGHRAALLGPAALPTQRSMLQEVWVQPGAGAGAGPAGLEGPAAVAASALGWQRFLWKLELVRELGCWMCTGIVPVVEEEGGGEG